MCGIAGIHVKENYIGELPLDAMADDMLLSIEHRGKHATGIASVGVDGGGLLVYKQPKPASWFVCERPKVADGTRTVLLHTRWATQGEPEKNENNHPVNYRTCFAVHNGHISNDWDVFEQLGVQRTADVDSQAIVAALAEKGFDNKEGIKEALEMLGGGMATAAIDPVNAPGRLLLARSTSSPLWVLNTKQAIMWASTKDTLTNAWGAFVGTPSSTYIRSREIDGNIPRGFRDFYYGEMWLIDGDEVVQDFFNPYHDSTSYGYYGSPWDGGESDSAVRHRRADGGPSFYIRKRWTCSPSWSECDHKCDNGCMAANCTCVEKVRVYPGGREEPIESNVVNISAARTKCESCWEWFTIDDLKDYHVGTSTYPLCTTCANEWDIESWSDDSNLEAEFESLSKEAKNAKEKYEADFCISCGEVVHSRRLLINGECEACRTIVKDSETQSEACGVEVFAPDREEALLNKLAPNGSSLRAYEGAAEIFTGLHTRTCRKLAKDFGCSPDFADWLLFRATPATLQSEFLANSRKILEGHYKRLYDEFAAELGD